MLRLVRGTIGTALVAVGVLAAPGVAFADAAGPTDYRTDILEITPATPAIEVTVEGGDSFLHIEVAAGHEVVVLGYAPSEEPYLRIGVDGTVEHNLRSYATYYNEERYGSDDIPDLVDNSAAPLWEPIGSGGSWAWHDHRAHWMGDEPPIGMEPGDSFPADVVPLLVDGERVEIIVVTTLQAAPSIWPAVLGLLLGLQVAMLGVLAGPATTVLSSLALSAAAFVVGVAQFRSLPSETEPLVTWWLLPAVALACAVIAIATYGRSTLLRAGLLALTGLQLLVWGVRRREGLTAAVLPTDLPAWFDRAATAAVLAGAAVVIISAVRQMFTDSVAPEPATTDSV